jgi:uncharacterized membrane protein
MMNDVVLLTLTMVAALGCGLNAGVFFAFSTFVMRALGRLPPPQGIAAMQSINIRAVTPLFMSAFLGTGVACIVLAVAAATSWESAGAGCTLAGSVLYLGGSMLVTIAGNVPLNNALAVVDPERSDGAVLWAHYLRRWTAWNHVRTIACLGAAALFTWALGERLRA